MGAQLETGLRISERAEAGVIVLDQPAALTTAEVARYLQCFDDAIARAQPFGMLVRYSSGAPRKSREGHRLESAWIAQHKPAMTRWCFGMAMVSNGKLFTALSKIAMKGLGTRLLGCPCNAFTDDAAALRWLAAQPRLPGATQRNSGVG